MRRDVRVYLIHIKEAITQIREYTKGVSAEDFLKSRLVQDGVIRQLEIIGEATKNIPEEIKRKAPKVPWKDMAGMRDVLIHQYFGVDLSAVWDTVELELPPLEIEISKLLENID